MTEYPIFLGEIEVEVRAAGGGRTLSASFPYNRIATVASGGRVRKERFNSGSLSWQTREFEKLQTELSTTIAAKMDATVKAKRLEALEDALEKRNTFLLSGHDYNRAIADVRSGTLAVEHGKDGVLLRASLPPEGQAPSWVEDTVQGREGGAGARRKSWVPSASRSRAGVSGTGDRGTFDDTGDR